MERVLDLFCGAGGAAVGYHRAGFDVVGVDSAPQPHYPFPFVRADALAYLEEYGGAFDLIHASPPCQRYSATRSMNVSYAGTVDLVPPTRAVLQAVGRPYVIENVPGAPLIDPVELCGQFFGVRVLRHRLFECSFPVVQPEHYEHLDWIPFRHRREREFADTMGCIWMNRDEARQSFPPVYTYYIATMGQEVGLQ